MIKFGRKINSAVCVPCHRMVKYLFLHSSILALIYRQFSIKSFVVVMKKYLNISSKCF